MKEEKWERSLDRREGKETRYVVRRMVHVEAPNAPKKFIKWPTNVGEPLNRVVDQNNCIMPMTQNLSPCTSPDECTIQEPLDAQSNGSYIAAFLGAYKLFDFRAISNRK